MIKAVKIHIAGITKTIETLVKGKFLYYFIPGLIIGLIYLYFMNKINTLETIVQSSGDVPYVGGILTTVGNSFVSLFKTVSQEFYKFLVLIALSPLFCILSERFDEYITGKKFEFSILRLLKDILRMVFIIVIALIMEYIFLAVFWVLSWVLPDVIGDVLFFLISAFFIGFSFHDYNLERYGINTLRSFGFAFSKMSYMIVTGAIFNIIIWIPWAGIIVAPVLTSMIATFVYIKMRESNPPIATETSDLLDN